MTMTTGKSDEKTPINLLIANKYLVIKKIGAGAFGAIYIGENIITKEFVAVKIESRSVAHPQLEYEAKVYKNLIGTPCIPWLYYYGAVDAFNALVIDLLGPSLEDLFNYCSRRFSLKTVLMLSDQALSRIEYVHYKHFVHRDIKPDNFAFGLKHQMHNLCILDFGLAKRYRDPKSLVHIPYRENKNLTGTARYVSINTHMGLEHGRRDDLESLGYVLIYFLAGSLPWQGLKAHTRESKYKQIFECKLNTPIEILCRGLPPEFLLYLNYVRTLHFDERPDYAHLRKLFRNVMISKQFEYDNKFDWILQFENEVREGKRHKLPALGHGEMSPVTYERILSYLERCCHTNRDSRSSGKEVT